MFGSRQTTFAATRIFVKCCAANFEQRVHLTHQQRSQPFVNSTGERDVIAAENLSQTSAQCGASGRHSFVSRFFANFLRSFVRGNVGAVGGRIANIGVHGKLVGLHLETLWDRNIAITTRLVDTATIPMLFKTAAAKTIDPALLISHRFTLDEGEVAYETFGNAAKTKARKVIISPA
jgi:threonine dehydrogenase-like Zn-dependent dehydrogenase